MNVQDRERLKQLIREHTTANTATREAALASLVRMGTHYPNGAITPEYGGEWDPAYENDPEYKSGKSDL